jgi:hypothetical protein
VKLNFHGSEWGKRRAGWEMGGNVMQEERENLILFRAESAVNGTEF